MQWISEIPEYQFAHIHSRSAITWCGWWVVFYECENNYWAPLFFLRPQIYTEMSPFIDQHIIIFRAPWRWCRRTPKRVGAVIDMWYTINKMMCKCWSINCDVYTMHDLENIKITPRCWTYSDTIFWTRVWLRENLCPRFFSKKLQLKKAFFNILVVYIKLVTDFSRRATRTYSMDQTSTRDRPDFIIIQ